MRYLPKMQQLKVFQEVVRAGSIRAAARILGQSQPAISRTLKELEQLLKTTLFLRGSQGITLTRSGQLFAVRSRFILEELQRAGDEIHFLHTQQSAVNVAVSSILALTVLPDVLAKFQQLQPLTQLTVREQGKTSRLLSGELDFAIVPVHGFFPEELRVQRLFQVPLRIVANRWHPQVQACDLQQLTGSQWLIAGEESKLALRLNEPLNALVQSRDSPPLRTDSLLYGLQLVQQTNYLMLLPHSQHAGFSDTLRVLNIHALPQVHYAAIWLKKSPLTTSAQQLLTLFHQACSGFTQSGRDQGSSITS